MKKWRLIQSIRRRMTIVFVIGIIGTFGRVEHGMFGWLHCFAQIGIFAMIVCRCYGLDQGIERKIRRWKRR